MRNKFANLVIAAVILAPGATADAHHSFARLRT